MKTQIDPYDLGKVNLADYSEKISIDSVVRNLKGELKKKILESKISIIDERIKLTTSDTRFGGKRFWFLCPMCQKRVGVLYKYSLYYLIGCRVCLKLKYKKQRYKGMAE